MEAAMIDIHEVYPYLCVHSAGEAIDFYTRAFDAKELFRLTEPSGRIGHAEIKIGRRPSCWRTSFRSRHPRTSLARRNHLFDSSARGGRR